MDLPVFTISPYRSLLFRGLLLLALDSCLVTVGFSRTHLRREAKSLCKPVVSHNRIEVLNPVTRQKLEAAMLDLRRRGLSPTLTTTFRSNTEQKSIYSCYHKRNCRMRRGIFNAARPGTSLHEAGLAVDVAGVASGKGRHRHLTRNGKKIVRVMQQHGFNWPHGLRDPVHFEIPPKQAGYRSERTAINVAQQRWHTQSRATSCQLKTKGQRVAGGHQKSESKGRLQTASNLRLPTRR